MLKMFKKSALFFSMIVSLFASFSLEAARSSRIFVYDGSQGYTFTASYKLYTADQPSGLQIDVIAEYNSRNSRCVNFWLLNMRLLELRYAIGSEQERVRIWKTKENRLDLERVNVLNSSIHSLCAIEKLAEEFGKQWYKLNYQNSEVSPQLQVQNGLMHVQPMENYKLSTTCEIDTHATKMGNARRLNVDVQEELYRGKKEIIASVSFCHKRGARFKEEVYLFPKFVQTKYGLKEISRGGFKQSSSWYSYVKKIAQKSVDRYLRFKKRYSSVPRLLLMKQQNDLILPLQTQKAPVGYVVQ
jgi:hypothetical protein